MQDLAAVEQAFKQLQAQLCDRWQEIETVDTGHSDILVIPSFSVDQQELQRLMVFCTMKNDCCFP